MIALDVDGDVARLTLDRASARNAIPTDQWRALADLVAAIPASAKAVVVRSAVPGIFSAGADLADLARLVDDVPARATFRSAMRAGIDALAALPMPVVAAVDGACHGAAVALALAADVIVAGPAARFAIPPAKLGISYPADDIARLAARVGRGQAGRLLFTAAPIDAGEALRIGLADLLGDGESVAAAIAANDRDSLRLLKRAIIAPNDPGHTTAFEDAFGSAAFSRGVARFRGDG